MKNFAADGATLPRSPDHRDGPRFKEEFQSVDRCGGLAAFELLARFVCKRGWKNYMKLACVGTYLDRKPGCPKHVQHRMVCGDNVCLKHFDSICGSDLCKLTKQHR